MLKDARYAIRMLTKSPMMTTVAILSLALGIGGNSTIFSIVYSFLFSPLPFHDPARIVLVLETDPKEADDQAGVAPANFLDWGERQDVFDSFAATTSGTVRLTGDGPSEQLNGSTATANFFDTLGVAAIHGRTFADGEDIAGSENVVILSHQLFVRRFGGDPTVVGRSVEIDGTAHTVIGVMDETFEFFDATVALWRPLVFGPEARALRSIDDRSLMAVGRLIDGTTVARAHQQMAAIATTLALEYPEKLNERRANAFKARDLFPGRVDTILVSVLMAAVGFVLLIACANIANLLLARGESRREEIAVRAALGAGRARIMGQMLTESLLLAVLGGAAGVGLASIGVPFLASAIPPQMPRSMVPALNPQVLGFTVLVTVLAGLVFGSMPALLAARTNLTGTLRAGGRSDAGSSKRGWLRSALVVGQVSMAVVLLAGAAILVRTFQSLQPKESGFNSSNLLTVQIALEESSEVSRTTHWPLFFEGVERRLRAMPEVTSVTTMSALPRSRGGGPEERFTIDGQPVEPGEESTVTWLTVTPEYFSTLAIPVQGRVFGTGDHQDAVPVAIVNRRFAEQHLGNAAGGAINDVIGKRITIQGKSRQIVGVSANIYQRRIIERDGASPVVYLPYPQAPQREMFLVARTRSEPTELAAAARIAIAAEEPSQPIGAVVTMDEHIAEMMAGPRSISQVVTALGVLALLLASIGIYGVMAHSVSLRRREIGIRMAMGAGRVTILHMITRQGLKLIVIGFVLAIPGTWGVLRLLASAFNDIPAADLLAPAVMLCVLLLSGLLASFLPARGAARVNPAETLRG